MTLTCTLKNATKKVVVVAINPPLKGYDDVKPRLLEMKALSQEGLGMVTPPQVDGRKCFESMIPFGSDKIAANNLVPISERGVMGQCGSFLRHPLRRLRPLHQRIVITVPHPGPIPAFLCQPESLHVHVVVIDRNPHTRGLVCRELVLEAQSAPQSLGRISTSSSLPPMLISSTGRVFVDDTLRRTPGVELTAQAYSTGPDRLCDEDRIDFVQAYLLSRAVVISP
jgi:hypothetical protein